MRKKLDKKNMAVFMDRDGTLCEDVGYLDDPMRLRLFPNVFRAIKRLNQMGIKAVIVTNQSGIARGFFPEETVLDIHDRLIYLLNEKEASVDNIYYCPHHPDDGCGCRKPMPGLLKKASMDMAIDLNASYMVGDQTTDIELACGVGAKGVLVMTGLGPQSLKELELKGIKPHYVSGDIGAAVDWIIKDMGK
ncbi:MAG: D-glycero-alpha-D-manno-heptose-1,7-bisphosphate 7-phosphatase [Thermodesulfobacteriota bacterium]